MAIIIIYAQWMTVAFVSWLQRNAIFERILPANRKELMWFTTEYVHFRKRNLSFTQWHFIFCEFILNHFLRLYDKMSWRSYTRGYFTESNYNALQRETFKYLKSNASTHALLVYQLSLTCNWMMELLLVAVIFFLFISCHKTSNRFEKSRFIT